MTCFAIYVSEGVISKEVHEPHMKTVLTGINMVKKKITCLNNIGQNLKSRQERRYDLFFFFFGLFMMSFQ